MVKEKSEVVSKSDAARRWGVTPQAVSKYVSRGLPVLQSGKLDWEVADQWRRDLNASSRAGSYRASLRAGGQAPEPLGTSDDFRLGASWALRELCTSARRAWPEFISTLRIEPRSTRALIAAVMSHLIDRWSSGFVDADTLPAIDWTPFGKDSAALQREWESLRAEWLAGSADGV